MEKTVATIIRRTPLTETSLIVHWCSADMGIVKTVAKGARRPRSPFAGKLDLFYSAEIEIVRSRKSDLHILKDLALIHTRLGLRKTYLQTLAASYFVQLIESAVEPEHPIPELTDLLERGLDYLNEHSPDLKAIRHFETEAARCLGIAEPGHSAADTLAETLGKLPTPRVELLERLTAAKR